MRSVLRYYMQKSIHFTLHFFMQKNIYFLVRFYISDLLFSNDT